MESTLVLLCPRSQRDTQGEREARMLQMRSQEEQLQRIESEIETASTDQKGFEQAFRQTISNIRQHK